MERKEASLMFLHKSNFLFRWVYPRFLWKMPNIEKVIYLTFDDGPIPEVTEFVLSQLIHYQAKATFFCIGDNVRKHPEIFQKLIEGGHSIGSHTFNHLNGWKSGNLAYIENFEKCNQLLAEKKVKTNFFRPPYGRIKKAQAEEILKTHSVVMWDVLSGDFSQELSPETVLKKSIRYTQNGSIVVFHDSLKARRNLEYALPRYLEHFSKKGFVFKSLTAQ